MAPAPGMSRRRRPRALSPNAAPPPGSTPEARRDFDPLGSQPPPPPSGRASPSPLSHRSLSTVSRGPLAELAALAGRDRHAVSGYVLPTLRRAKLLPAQALGTSEALRLSLLAVVSWLPRLRGTATGRLLGRQDTRSNTIMLVAPHMVIAPSTAMILDVFAANMAGDCMCDRRWNRPALAGGCAVTNLSKKNDLWKRTSVAPPHGCTSSLMGSHKTLKPSNDLW